MSEFTPGQRVRQQREQRGLTRERLALLSGTSTSTVARLELSNRMPNAAALARITEQLDISIDSLFATSAAS